MDSPTQVIIRDGEIVKWIQALCLRKKKKNRKRNKKDWVKEANETENNNRSP